jgi:hypothetical protein
VKVCKVCKVYKVCKVCKVCKVYKVCKVCKVYKVCKVCKVYKVIKRKKNSRREDSIIEQGTKNKEVVKFVKFIKL